MPTDNKHRLWSFGRSCLVKRMPQAKTAAVGLYAVNGTSAFQSLKTQHKERIVKRFEAIRERNSTIEFCSPWTISLRTRVAIYDRNK